MYLRSSHYLPLLWAGLPLAGDLTGLRPASRRAVLLNETGFITDENPLLWAGLPLAANLTGLRPASRRAALFSPTIAPPSRLHLILPVALAAR
jgi:hypothetical protein